MDGIVKKRIKRRREAGNVAGRDEHASFTIDHNIRNAARLERDDRRLGQK